MKISAEGESETDREWGIWFLEDAPECMASECMTARELCDAILKKRQDIMAAPQRFPDADEAQPQTSGQRYSDIALFGRKTFITKSNSYSNMPKILRK